MKVIRTLHVCILLISIFTACSTKYIKSEYQDKSLPEKHTIRVSYYNFWGVSGLSFTTYSDMPIVNHVEEGFPAQRAGLRQGDIIVQIDGYQTEGKSEAEIMKMLEGEAGSQIRMNIQRNEEARVISYSRGISNGLKCVEKPYSVVQVAMIECERIERREIEHYKRENLFFLLGTSLAVGGLGYVGARALLPEDSLRSSLSGSIGLATGAATYLVLYKLLPTNLTKSGDIDTVTRGIRALTGTFVVKDKFGTVKQIESNSRGILEIALRDYYSNVLYSNDLALSIEKSGSSLGSAELRIPAAYWTLCKQMDDEVELLYVKAHNSYNSKKYGEVIDICEIIESDYSKTHRYLDARKLKKKAHNDKIRLDLLSSKHIDLSSYLGARDFGPLERSYVIAGLRNMKPENGAVCLVEGLGMSMDVFEAMVEFRKLSLAQQLYAILYTSEVFARATAGDDAFAYLTIKEELLYDWIQIPRAVVYKLTLLTSGDIIKK